MISDCWNLKRSNKEEAPPNAFVTALKPHFTDSPNYDIYQVKEKIRYVNDVREKFRPFVSEGIVRLDSETLTPLPITLLHDTGAAQHLALASVLLIDSSSATGEEVIASCIENDIIHILLSKIRCHLILYRDLYLLVLGTFFLLRRYLCY